MKTTKGLIALFACLLFSISSVAYSNNIVSLDEKPSIEKKNVQIPPNG